MLKYKGKWGTKAGFIPGIPARDISADELKEKADEWARLLGTAPSQVVKALVKSGLYQRIKGKKGGE